MSPGWRPGNTLLPYGMAAFMLFGFGFAEQKTYNINAPTQAHMNTQVQDTLAKL